MPFKKGEGGRPKGIPNKATREIKEIARALLEDPTYLKTLEERLSKGTAGAVEGILYYYAYGKPKEQLEHSGTVAVATTVIHEHVDSTKH